MQWRNECYTRFGPVLSLPLRSLVDELPRLLSFQCRVLDVGAGAHKPLQALVESSSAKYFTMDTDPNGTFDFRSFEDVQPDAYFDIVVADQVLEHMSLGDAFGMVCEAFRHLSEGGWLIASVPNTAHPVRQWDCTHVTPWPTNDLYSLLRSAGFVVRSMSRFNKYPLTSNPFKRWVVNTVCREFRVDWCDSIMAIGQKNG
jgi:trans-aconitate methyltransferase